LALFTLSVVAIFGFSFFRSKKFGQKFLDSSSKKLFVNFLIPFTIGSLIILKLMIFGGELSFISTLRLWNILAPISLFVYGTSLFSARNNMPKIFTILAWTEIILGILALLLPAWFTWKLWILGFGVMHIVVGIWLMVVNRSKRQEPRTKNQE
jgi:peptidoglycan biosynthesis protein MviN/MurJ (putative lipid II flippase)